MTRIAAIGLFSIAIAGCAQDRANRSKDAITNPMQEVPPAGLAPLESIRASINQRSVPADPTTVRAGYNPEESAKPDPLPALPPTVAARPNPRPKPIAMADGGPGMDLGTTPIESPQPNGDNPPTAGTDADPQPSASIESKGAGKTLEAGIEVVDLPPPASSNPTPEAVDGAAPAGTDLPSPSRAEEKPAEATSLADLASIAPLTKPRGKKDEIAFPTRSSLAPGRETATVVARVGDTVITARELKFSLDNFLSSQNTSFEALGEQDQIQAGKMVLERLIDNTVVIQDFRKEMKKPTQWDTFTKAVEQAWRERELPARCKHERVEGELALRKKLEAQGKSLDDVKESFKMESMGHELLLMKVQPKVPKPNRPEMERYYRKHRQEYDRPEGLRWREIFLPVEPNGSLAAAKAKAAAIRKRIERGEKFEEVARAESQGATARNGGDWGITVPGSYGVAKVNEALTTLPIGRVSEPIEGPRGVHLVKVEMRRAAGPASFVEVQKDVAEKVFQETFLRERADTLKKLRAQTHITSFFDKDQSAIAREQPKVDPDTRPAAAR